MNKFKRKKISTTVKKDSSEQNYRKLIKSLLSDRPCLEKQKRRQSKLTSEREAQILQSIETGMTIQHACQLVSITPMSYHMWMQQGRAEENRIREEYDTIMAILIEKGELNAGDAEEVESFTDEFLKFQPPNKFFNFFINIKKAEAISYQRALTSVSNAQVGKSYLTEVIKETDAEGNVIKEIQHTKYLKPDWNAGAWFLERRLSSIYGRKAMEEDSKNKTAEDTAREIHDAMRQMDESISGK